jgi:transposase InsO family protein
VPPELQQQVHQEVKQTKRRSRWPVRKTLAVLGVSRTSYYRWRREQAWARSRTGAPTRPVQVYEALPEEKQATLAYARAHPAIRHRELAWRMVDEDVACLSPSTVYRVLREAQLICPWRRREKRYRNEWEKAKRRDERWATDILQLKVGKADYFLVAFLDEWSRYIVHHELLTGVDGPTVSLAAQAAVETLQPDKQDKEWRGPEIRSDNGSGYISKEFRDVLRENKFSHHRIKPHCPEENGLIERAYRTFREALDGEELDNLLQARDVLKQIVRWYNEERLHSALGYLRPIDYYRGDPERLQALRRIKLAQARHARREVNLKIRQRTLPLTGEKTSA